MKKLLILFFALGVMPVMGQNVTPLSQSSNKSMLEVLAEDQVQILTSRLSLNEQQQQKVSVLVLGCLKSEKFQKLLGEKEEGSLLNSDEDGTHSEKIQNNLLLDNEFQKGMKPILNEDQIKTMSRYIPS
jgi:hypothetical protein